MKRSVRLLVVLAAIALLAGILVGLSTEPASAATTPLPGVTAFVTTDGPAAFVAEADSVVAPPHQNLIAVVDDIGIDGTLVVMNALDQGEVKTTIPLASAILGHSNATALLVVSLLLIAFGVATVTSPLGHGIQRLIVRITDTARISRVGRFVSTWRTRKDNGAHAKLTGAVDLRQRHDDRGVTRRDTTSTTSRLVLRSRRV